MQYCLEILLIRRYEEFGSLSFIQLFGSALNLNVHIHALVFDGVMRPMNVVLKDCSCEKDVLSEVEEPHT